MQIVATHSMTDFDALASMVAATFLYPEAIGALPTRLLPNVQEFLAIHKDLFRLCSVREIDPSGVTSLVIVDTNHWSRLDPLKDLQDRTDLEISLWDHHMEGGNVNASWSCREPTGAAVTLLLRRMREGECAFTPMHATLFLLGLYEDTGNLTYPSVTPEDAYTAGFLLENGADLNVAGAYLASSFDDNQTEVLTQLLNGATLYRESGYHIGTSLLRIHGGGGLLAPVVAKFRDIKHLDVAFAVFATDQQRSIIIGRGGSSDVNVGAVMRRLGGGGHFGAGSAVVHGKDPDVLYRELETLIRAEIRRPRLSVRDIMSRAEPFLSSNSGMEAARTLLAQSRLRAIPVVENGEFRGIVSEVECCKPRTPAQMKAPVRAYMKTRIPTLHPDQNIRESLRLMTEVDSYLLPVIEDGKMIGMVRRADLILHMYRF